MTTLNSMIFQKLEGHSRRLGGAEMRFVGSDNGKPATWAGGEGFAAPVDLAGGDRHILKLFKLPTIERLRRAHFLSTLALPSLRALSLPLFAAAPLWPIFGALSVPGEADLEVTGHLARFIHGRSFEDLLMKGWSPPITVRARLARQLCLAVEILEGAGALVHGDLSAANVMIVDAESSNPKLTLIDFDGFYHPGVPPVPISRGQSGGRSWGTPGYRASAFKKGTDQLVDSDRVAMAILAFELAVLRTEDADILPGDTLLEQKDIDARKPVAPEEIVSRWPEGWDLLQEAVAVSLPLNAPSPRKWRRALERLEGQSGAPRSVRDGPPPLSRAGNTLTPFIVFVRQWGHEDRQVRLSRTGGTFAPVGSDLSWLAYSLDKDRLLLSGTLPHPSGSTRAEPLLVRHGGPHADWTRYDGSVIDATVRFGDVIHWGDFDIYLG